METQRIAQRTTCWTNAVELEQFRRVQYGCTPGTALTENREASTYLQPPEKLPRRKCMCAPRVELVEGGP